MPTWREIYNCGFGVGISLILLFFTVCAVVAYLRKKQHPWCPVGIGSLQTGKVIVALWILIPPFFLWGDWVLFASSMCEAERSVAEHLHDLIRNMWLALVTVLAFIYGIHIVAKE